jgi:hypothetical protein
MSPDNPGVASTDILAILVVTCPAKEKDIGHSSSRKTEHDGIDWTGPTRFTYRVYV